MMRRYLVLLIGLIMVTNIFSGDGPNGGKANPLAQYKDPLNPPRLITFKKIIKFEESLAEEKNQYVALNWSELKLPAELAAWKIVDNESSVSDRATIHTLKLQNEKKILTIIVNAFPAKNKLMASDLFLMKVNGTTMMDIFYIPSTEKIGTSSVIDKSTPPSTGLFLFHNIQTEIFSSSQDNSFFTFAKWIQSEYEKNLKPVP